MRKITFASLLALSCLCAAAQPKAKYDKSRYELGNISWHTQAIANIKLTNSGNKPLYITDVDTDCGCTVVAWDHSAIAPGASTILTATYDAETLGTFGRCVSITTNADTDPVDIVLAGRVLPEAVDMTGNFPYKIDDVLLATDLIEFDDVNLGEHPEVTISVMNNSTKDYAPEFMHLPKWLSVTASPEVLRPGRIGRATFILDSRQLPAMGLTQASIYVARFPGDKVRKAAEIGVSATLLPSFDLTENQMLNAPVAVIPSTLNLGPTLGKKRLKGALYLENQGASPLHVSALQVYNPGISVSLSKSTIEPGTKALLKVTTSASTGNFKGRPRILLITDDPNHSKIAIDITAE